MILGVVAGLVGFFAFVSQQPTRYEAPYSRGDFLRISAVAVGSLLACGVNPYGTALFELSFRMSESSGFIKASVIDHSKDIPQLEKVVVSPIEGDAIVDGDIVDPGLVADTISSMFEREKIDLFTSE